METNYRITLRETLTKDIFDELKEKYPTASEKGIEYKQTCSFCGVPSDFDLETFSSVPIQKAGAQKYIQSPDFEILLFAYSLNGAEPVCCDFAQGETLPKWVAEALLDPQCLKHAYNAPFEWGCLSRYMGRQLPPAQWRCTMLHGLYAGYTAGLDATGRALGLPEDKRKLNTGKALIRYFCVPCAPTKANGWQEHYITHMKKLKQR